MGCIPRSASSHVCPCGVLMDFDPPAARLRSADGRQRKEKPRTPSDVDQEIFTHTTRRLLLAREVARRSATSVCFW